MHSPVKTRFERILAMLDRILEYRKAATVYCGQSPEVGSTRKLRDDDPKAHKYLQRMLFLVMDAPSLELSATCSKCSIMAQLLVQEITSGRISVFYKTLT